MTRYFLPKFYWHHARNVWRRGVQKGRWLDNRARAYLFRRVGYLVYLHRARTIARMPEKAPKRDHGRVFIDISVICEHDGESGIQRVVRATAFLLANSEICPNFHPIFVYVKNNSHYIVCIENGNYIKTNEIAAYSAGDIFFGLDFSLDSIWRMRSKILNMKKCGVESWYLIHDFMPITNPDWFSSATVTRFFNWMAIIAATANGYFCVSRKTKSDLERVLTECFGMNETPLTHVIPMGCNLAKSRPSQGVPDGFDQLLARLSCVPSLMLVSTIEPRKGHGDALKAMEHLWARGFDVNLVLVGTAGWKVADFIEELENHPQRGTHLFWTGKISDEALDRLYGACTGMVFPSHGEGFGLPVIEALGHGKPVLVRQLEVYEPLCETGIRFFPEKIEPDRLADAIEEWLGQIERSEIQVRPDLLAGWEDTARFIAEHLTPISASMNQEER